MMNSTCGVVLSVCLVLVACSSSDDDSTPIVDSADESPVTGEFHSIQPGEVDVYVANFHAQQSRISFNFDSTDFPLSLVDIDAENNQLIKQFNCSDLLFIAFDFDSETPLPTLSVVELEDDGETVLRSWAGNDLSIQETPGEDFQYSGRLSNSDDDDEVDVSLVFNAALITAGTSTLVDSANDAILNGGLGTQSYVQMRDMIASNPDVTRLILQNSEGSVNDGINVHTGRLTHAAGLATYVPANGDIYYGAEDLFIAGVTRTVEPGGILGVHSWCCEDGVPANQLPGNDPAHGPLLTYSREMLAENGEGFYFFTLQAASSDSIHAMTREDMTQFGVVTE